MAWMPHPNGCGARPTGRRLLPGPGPPDLRAARVGREVAFGPRNLGLPGDAQRAAVEEALEAVGLAGESSTNPYDLGYSRRKLLTMASVLAMRTPGRGARRAHDRSGRARRGAHRGHRRSGWPTDGRTVIAISHDMGFVAEHFERVIVMRAGRVVLDGTPAEVFARAAWDTLASTYLEPPFAARVGDRLGLGSTPTDAAVVAALRARRGRPREGRGHRRRGGGRRGDPGACP